VDLAADLLVVIVVHLLCLNKRGGEGEAPRRTLCVGGLFVPSAAMTSSSRVAGEPSQRLCMTWYRTAGSGSWVVGCSPIQFNWKLVSYSFPNSRKPETKGRPQRTLVISKILSHTTSTSRLT
jgi:hypothetical protein